jgi:hypothetical protein
VTTTAVPPRRTTWGGRTDGPAPLHGVRAREVPLRVGPGQQPPQLWNVTSQWFDSLK